MRFNFRPLWMALSAFLVSSCEPNYPLGMSLQQWHGLSLEEQQKAITLQKQREAEDARRHRIQTLEAQKSRLENDARLRLGITDEEWAALSPDKRLELRKEQEQIARNEKAAEEQRNKRHQEESGTHAIAEALKERNRQEMYLNASYGTVVNCNISGGNAKFSHGFSHGFNGKWAPLATTSFSIAKGEAKTVEIRRLDKLKQSTTFWVAFNPNHILDFCASQDMGQRYKRCRSHAVTSSFEQGYTIPFFIPEAVDNAVLYCLYAPGRK